MQSKLDDFFTTPPNEEDRFRSNNSTKITRDFVYSIHSLATLGTLLTEKKQGKEVPDLRYLVDVNGVAWFARETHNDAPIAPAHYKMTGSPRNAAYCKTAGNLFFSEDYSTLIRINHKSGDFRPSFDSIKWILAIFVANEDRLPFKLPEILIIDELNHTGKVIQSHQCSIADIKKWLTTFALTLKLEAQYSETKEVSYKKEGASRLADIKKEGFVQIPRRLAFGDDDKENSVPFDDNKVSRKLAFEDDVEPEAPSMPALLDLPVRTANTYRALKNSSLPMFGTKRLTHPGVSQPQLTPLFSGQEVPTPLYGEESGPGTPPPLKKRKPRQPRHIDFVSSLAESSESKQGAETSTPESSLKGYFD
ncbi:hypothetical protein J2N86_12155 [Legionella lytica]|uniref:Uncharacterized protein n=1 Tax=Legionella lytica TaxID=96232 RepID=A0ABY4Y726_9GAMM|nr:hypothetical protein [Legionella lytica]USQ13428.1 hypothetical protein J2N86_12155 [Legionella lytica]